MTDQESFYEFKKRMDIQEDLDNKKLPWHTRKYLNRDLFHWINLYVGLLMIIIVLFSYPKIKMIDLFLMFMAGVSFYMFIADGFFNAQRKVIKAYERLSIKIIATLEVYSKMVNEE